MSKKILYVSSGLDLFPALKGYPTSSNVFILSKSISASPKYDLRLSVPRFGVINEYSNNIHDTYRLSGINIPMGRDRVSLIGKVPSIRSFSPPVYLVDNEELFTEKKGVFTDPEGNFFPDNDIRSVFFCKSVLAIMEHLAWIPDIIHCHGWMTSFVPLFLKHSFPEGHALRKTKVVTTLYDESFEHKFESEKLKKVLRYRQLKKTEVSLLEVEDFKSIINIAIRESDKVIRTFETPSDSRVAEVDFRDSEYVPLAENDKDTAKSSHIKIYGEMCKE